MGLVPIGRDADSGLWEFAHLQTGEAPLRKNGKLVLTEETGLVFVLLPGGAFKMGAVRPTLGVRFATADDALRIEAVTPGSLAEELTLQAGDVLTTVNGGEVKTQEDVGKALPSSARRYDFDLGDWTTDKDDEASEGLHSGDLVSVVILRGGECKSFEAHLGPNIDPQADPFNRDPNQEWLGEGPVREVTLNPFFLSKYEMTQGQWLRITGENPSTYGPDADLGGNQHSLLQPVESVDFDMWRTVLEVRLGLSLSTEAQWEYGARGGTTTVWYTGNEKESLKGAANIADLFAKNNGFSEWENEEWLDDGYTFTSPVGFYGANPFGLRDVVGNVREWCRDGYGSYQGPIHPGTGELWIFDPSTRNSRGGSFQVAAYECRYGDRSWYPPESRHRWVGVRPTRVITQ